MVSKSCGKLNHSALDVVINSFADLWTAAESLNQQFLSYQVARETPSFNSEEQNEDNRWAPSISVFDVHKYLRALKPCKAPGHDYYPSILYKKAADILAPPLGHVINNSILNRQFPTFWKMSVITPVPKCVPASMNDLRPISLLPVFSLNIILVGVINPI